MSKAEEIQQKYLYGKSRLIGGSWCGGGVSNGLWFASGDFAGDDGSWRV